MRIYPWQTALINAGARVCIVGGAVRDELLNKPTKDIDYLLSGLPMRKIVEIISRYGRVDFVGKSFGVLKFTPHQANGITHDLALPRREVSTGAGHRDFTVDYDHTLPVEVDLGRRDFTINAMARDIATGNLIDPFGGIGDLAAKKLRMVFPQAFAEDPLRMLRGIQFCARLGFTFEDETGKILLKESDSIRTVSPERIIEELGKLMTAPRPSTGFYLMAKTGLLKIIFPELDSCRGVAQAKKKNDDVFHHTMRVLDAARGDSKIENRGNMTLLWAALYHDVGKPKTRRYDPIAKRIAFYGHQLISKKIARKRLAALKVSILGVDIEEICSLIEHHMFETKAHFTDRAIRRFVSKVGPQLIWLLMDLRLADNRGGKYPDGIKGVLRLRQRIRDEMAKKPPFGARDLAINGHDLMKIGIPAGPQMGQLLHRLVEQCIDDPQLNTKTSLLELAREFIPVKSISESFHNNGDIS